MKLVILFFATFLGVQNVIAQSSSNTLVNYSLKGKKDPLVEIYTTGPSIYVEGYDGSDLIIEPYPVEPLKNSTAESLGLKNITTLVKSSSPALEKPPFIRESPNYVNIMFSPSDYPALIIKIPRSTHLKLSATGIKDRKVVIKNLTGELEVRGAVPLMEIDNIAGPLTVSSNAVTASKVIITNLKYDNKISDKNKALLYLSGFMSDFDISLPEDIKANIYIKLDNGDVYSDIDIVKTYGNSNNQNTISGTINGGGAYISIISTYGNVALRKQK